MNDKILEIASVHLGKAGDGTVVKPYETPTCADPSLLVPIPRELNRTQYGITTDLFSGRDVWNCYETSFLLDNGYPVSGVLVLEYDSDSPNIVESKSLKLYLNSYNMMRLGKDAYTARDNFLNMLDKDLTKAVFNTLPDSQSYTLPFVNCQFFFNTQQPVLVPPFTVQFQTIEDIVDVSDIDFTAFTEDPAILTPRHSTLIETQQLHTSALRSNCRVTNQPDWGDVYIHIRGYNTVSPESLLQYIVSMRQENHFHEEICEMIYSRLNTLLQPLELMVGCLYTRRGGIDINPVRASTSELLFRLTNISDVGIFQKTMRQ